VANDDSGVQTALTDLQKGLEQIGEQRALIGARLNRIESTRLVLEEVKFSTTSFESGIGDIDLAQAIAELRQQQNALEITRAIAARILDQPTLLNFLR
jgi:flagellar hook-associated protein 3 FlgL